MSGLEGVSLMVVVMDRGLLGLLLCLVVMCVAGAVGASIRWTKLLLILVFFTQFGKIVMVKGFLQSIRIFLTARILTYRKEQTLKVTKKNLSHKTRY